jgi:hypothetical protein
LVATLVLAARVLPYREPFIRTTGGKVERPLGESTHGGKTRSAAGNPEILIARPLPEVNAVRCLLSLVAKGAPKITGKAAELGAHAGLPEEFAESVVALAEQVLANVSQKVIMADQDRDGDTQCPYQGLSRFSDGPAKIAQGAPRREGFA